MRAKILVLAFVTLLSACTEPGETTGVAAATGGAIGAGLGAIIGSQTGDAGTGLALGATAGAGTGALVGNAFEAQDKRIQTQDEEISRQARVLEAQRSEMAELAGSRDGGTTATRFGLKRAETSILTPKLMPSDNGTPNFKEELTETTIATTTSEVSALPRPALNLNSAECAQAEAEAKSGSKASDSSDKLFHYRRALRLCPQNAAYHNSTGEVYLALNRLEDARYEFNEALKIDPEFDLAKTNLKKVE